MAKTSLAAAIEDDRRSDRTGVRISAGVRTARGRRVPVVVRNISCHGFMAEGAAAIVPGSIVTLDIDDQHFEARIAWRRDGHVGGAFIAPVSENVLAAII